MGRGGRGFLVMTLWLIRYGVADTYTLLMIILLTTARILSMGKVGRQAI